MDNYKEQAILLARLLRQAEDRATKLAEELVRIREDANASAYHYRTKLRLKNELLKACKNTEGLADDLRAAIDKSVSESKLSPKQLGK